MRNRKFFFTIFLTYLGFISVIAQQPAEADRVDLSTPQEFPPPAGRELILEEMFPIGLSNGDLLMVYRLWPLGGQTNDVLYSARSTDGGLSWEAPQTVHTIANGQHNWIQGLQTQSGRLIIAYYPPFGAGTELQLLHSDDAGISWSPLTAVATGDGPQDAHLSETGDGRLWLVYHNFDLGDPGDFYYRTSLDDGVSWGNETLLLGGPAFPERTHPTIASANNDTLLLFYLSLNPNPGFGLGQLFRRISGDGGATWSAALALTPDSLTTFHGITGTSAHRALRQADGTLWIFTDLAPLVFVIDPNFGPLYRWTDPISIYGYSSNDGGVSWNAQPFTRYAGQDLTSHTTLLNDQPFLQFNSSRWKPLINVDAAWYGILGVTVDSNPPPTGRHFLFNATTPSNIETVLKFNAKDESGVADVQGYYRVNNGPLLGPKPLFDDGLHQDGAANDGLWGGFLDIFQLGDKISATCVVTDIDNNSVSMDATDFEVLPYHNIGNIILQMAPNGVQGAGSAGAQLEAGAHWPRENGQDYLQRGSLWVGADVGGEKRVMTGLLDLSGNADWKPTPGSAVTIAPGVSDQDIRMRYDDRIPRLPGTLPIGLSVRQESFQWADSLQDDFIIFRYTVKNNGLNGDVNDVIVALAQDADVTLQTNSRNDQVAYDPERQMLYMYDNQGDPGGYVGLKMLGAGSAPFTVNTAEGSGFNTGEEYYAYLSSGFQAPPVQSGGYWLTLGAQPLDLAAGDSLTFAFGMALGEGLADLQGHADQMDESFKNIGIAAVATMFLAPGELGFLTEVGAETDTGLVTVYNQGVETLTISDMQVSGDAAFQLGALSLPASLGSQESLDITVRFTPPASGEYNATITVTSDDPRRPVQTVTLRGDGFQVIPAEIGSIYAVTGAASSGALLTLDPGNGSGSVVGSSGFPAVLGAAVRPSNGELYGIVDNGALSLLVRIDAASGRAYRVADIPVDNIRDIAFDNADHLYGGVFSNGWLYQIDPSSGAAALIGSTDARPMTGLTVNPLNGQLWGSALNSNIYTIDKTTGQTTLVGPTGISATAGIEFDADGKLFGVGTVSGSAPGLIRIDTTSGTATVIGPVGSGGINSLGIRGTVVTGIDDGLSEALPKHFVLEQNYPNPFNPATAIRYSLPVASDVTLTIYDLVGRKVLTLVKTVQLPGEHEAVWEGKNAAGAEVSSGIYIYQLRASDFIERRKMLLIR